MGTGWRRFTESIKQHAPVPSRFSPTSNERNEKTLEEAAGVARKIKDVISDIENMNKATEIYDFVGVTDAPSASPLAAGSETSASPGSPLPEGVRTRRAGGVAPVGEARPFTEVDGTAASSILEDHRAKLEEEVLRPLRAWLSAHEQLRKKNEEVEALRLEVDSRRRTVSELTVKAAKKEGKLQENADSKAEAALGQARDVLGHKSDKLRAAAAAYAQGEAALHEQLVALLDDARYVQAYATKATRFQADLLAQLATVIEGPVPAGSREGDGGISLQGFETAHRVDNGVVGGWNATQGTAELHRGSAEGRQEGEAAAGAAAALGGAAAAPAGAAAALGGAAAADPSAVPADASAVPPFAHAGEGAPSPTTGVYGTASPGDAFGEPAPALAPAPAPGFPSAAETARAQAAAEEDGAAGIWGVVPGTDGALEQTTQGLKAASLEPAQDAAAAGADAAATAAAPAASWGLGAAQEGSAAPQSLGAVGKHYVDVEDSASGYGNAPAPVASSSPEPAYGAAYGASAAPAASSPAPAVGKHYVEVEEPEKVPAASPAFEAASPAFEAASPAFEAVSYDDPSGFSAVADEAERVAAEASPLQAAAAPHAHTNPFEDSEAAFGGHVGLADDSKPTIPGL